MTATITKWTPFGGFEPMEWRMRRLLQGIGAPMVPAADVYETPTELVLELEVPGFEEKQLGIEVSDHTLTVHGERKLAKEESEKSYLLQERLETTFERRFLLPLDTDTAHVKAVFGKGVLEVHAPKLAPVTPQNVEITKA